MERATLGNIIEFVRNGASIKQNEGHKGYPITRIETIWNSTIDEDRFGYANIFDSDLEKYEKYLLQKNDILISHINSPKHLGKSAIYQGYPEKIIHGMNLLLMRVNKKLCFPKYLFYFLQTKDYKEQINKVSNQSVNQASFSTTSLKLLQIALPDLPTQQKIAALLDKADELRQYNKQLIQKYDDLMQSLFLDMFGDPVSNEKGWDKKLLKDVTIKIGSGSTPRGGKEAYFSEGISLIRSLNIHDNKFKYKDLAFINDEQAARLKNVIVEENDVLFNITGASVCRCAIVPSQVLPARVNQHVSIIRVNPKKLSAMFLTHLLISPIVKNKLYTLATQGGATREAITLEQLKNIEIIFPSINLQNQFADRAQLIEQQKEQAQQVLQKSEELFNSLLQKAFKGELVAEYELENI